MNNIHFTPYQYSSVNRDQEERNTQLLNSIENGADISSIRTLIIEGADVNCTDAEGNTPLILAAMVGNIDVVKELLIRKAKIDLSNNHGDTALIGATLNGRLPIVRLLLESKASIDHKNNDGEYTALMLAVLHNHVAIVETMLDHGPNLEAENIDGDTALMFACGENFSTLVELLLKKGASPNKSNKRNDSPLLLATACGHYDIVVKLLDYDAKIDAQREDGTTALYMASQKGNIAILELLLRKGASTNRAWTNGASPLAIASFKGLYEVVQELLKWGGDILDMSQNHHAPPVNARLLGHRHLLKTLLEKMTLEQKKIFKEALRIISLGHMTHQDGSVKLKFIDSTLASKKVMLGSGHGSYWIQKIQKSLPLLSKEAADLFSSEEIAQFNSFLKCGTDLTSHEIYRRFKNGLPILLLTGWQGKTGHAIAVVISRSYFLSFNFIKAPCLQVFKYDSDLLSPQIIEKIVNLGKLPEEEFIKQYTQQLPKELAFENAPDRYTLTHEKTKWEVLLPRKCPLTPQRAKNCSYASLEGAMWGYIALNSLLQNKKSFENSSSSSPKEALKIASKKFYTLISINQIYNLERYIGTHLFRPMPEQKQENSPANRDLIFIDREFVATSIEEIKKNLEFIAPEQKSELSKVLACLEQKSEEIYSSHL